MYCYIKTTKKETFQIYRPSYTIFYKIDWTRKKKLEKNTFHKCIFEPLSMERANERESEEQKKRRAKEYTASLYH